MSDMLDPPRVRRVLIVDDDIDLGVALREYLQMLGHEVHLAHDGASALIEAARHASLDLVVLDWQLPVGPSGTPLLSTLRRATNASILVISGDRGALVEAQAASANACLAKPFTLGDLREILTTLGVLST
jgi:DNA-binding response OmpR family regulator